MFTTKDKLTNSWKTSLGVVFQCKLTSDYEVIKYAPMTNQQILMYQHNQQIAAERQRRTYENINRSYVSPVDPVIMDTSTKRVRNGNSAYDKVYGNGRWSERYDKSNPYTSFSGGNPKYDLTKPLDRHEYSTDLMSQHNDQMNLNRQMDMGVGQYGGGY